MLTVVAGLADALAGLLATSIRLTRARLELLAALGAGFILAAALLDLVPEVLSEAPNAAPLIALGYLTLFTSEHIFSRRAHKPSPSDHGDAHSHDALHGHALVEHPRDEGVQLTTTAGLAAFVGLTLHAYFDGVAIVSGFAQATGLGALVFVAVLLHKLPEGFSLAAIVLAAGRRPRTALAATAVLGLATLGGGLTVLGFGEFDAGVVTGLLAFAAGTFIYVGATDLIPAVNAGASRATLPLVLAGFGIFYVLLRMLEASGLAG